MIEHVFTGKIDRLSVLLHDFPARCTWQQHQQSWRKVPSHLFSIIQVLDLHLFNRGEWKCYRHPATHNKQCITILWQVTLKGKAKEPHWSQRIKPEDLYSVGGSSSSNSSRTTELFVLGNILLQVKWLQRNSTYKAISCLLRVRPVLRVAARTFRYQSQKRIQFYLLSIQKN